MYDSVTVRVSLSVSSLWVRVLGLAVVVGLVSYLARSWFLDDALIYARYVRDALGGEGLVFNVGEHTNALSSPVYSYLVLLASWVGDGHVLAATAVVSGVFLFLAAVVAEMLFPFAGFLLASTSYFYSLVGMETSTFLFLLLLVVLLVRSGRVNALPTACFLLLLTRFEGGAILPGVMWALWRERRWPRWWSYGPAVLLGAVYLGLNHRWYGAWVPTSASAKLGQGRSELWGRWPWAFTGGAYQLKPDFLPTVYVVVLVAMLAAVGVWRLRETAFWRVVLPTMGILLGFYVVCNLPGYRWYFAPFIAFAMVYACAGLPVLGRWRWVMVPVMAASLGTAVLRFWPRPARAAPVRTGYEGIATWVRKHAAPEVRLEAAEIGTLGWDCPRCRVLDILGLTMPKNAEHIARKDLTSWLGEDRPDLIVVHDAPWAYEEVAKRSAAYERVPVDFGPEVYLLRRRGDAAAGR